MATIEGDRPDEGPEGREDRTPDATGGGDLEFDEAWADAAAANRAGDERQERDPAPTFEDPNDR